MEKNDGLHNHGNPSPKQRPSLLGRTFTALQYPNYRLWFIGQIVSLFGTWMQNTAQGFLVYELTHSPAFLGYVGFAAGVPSWMFMLLGGVASDRIPRRTLLVITQTIMMVLAFILAGLTATGVVQPWHIILLAFCLGVANAFDAPARMALAPELVDRKDLTNAIALNATMFNTGAILGPTLASLIYAATGPAWCFFLNGMSFIAVIGALLLMKFQNLSKVAQHKSPRQELSEGIHFVFHEQTVRSLIFLVGATSLLGFSFVTLLPAWAVDILGGDVKTNGLLNSARGLGALIGALSIASLGRFNYRGRLLSLGTFIFPLLLLLFSMVRRVPLSMLTLVGIGGALVLILNLANSLVQTHVDDDIRGRVMGIYSLTFFGLLPIGSLMMGQIAEFSSEPVALAIGSILLFGVAILIKAYVPQIWKLE